MSGAFRRPLRVKLILPALTEATSPYWRPIHTPGLKQRRSEARL